MMTQLQPIAEPKRSMNTRLLTHIGMLALLFLVHFGAGVLALSSELVVFAETLTWIPAGVALAAFLLWGPRMWPAIAAGTIAISFYDNAPWQSAIISSLANTAGPLVSSWMLRSLDFRPTLQRIRDVVLLAAVGSVVGPLVTSTIGAVTLKAIGRFADKPLFELWWFWWRGDSLAILLVTPFLLVWLTGQPEWRRAKIWEAAAAFALLLTSSLLVFGLLFPGATFSPPGAFVHFPVLIWVAMRLGLHGAVTANLLLLAITGWGTALGQGPFARPSLEATLILHWAFLGATSLSSLILAAAVREQRTTREALEQSEERYRDFMEQSPDGIWRIELEKPLSLGLPEDRQLQHLLRYCVLAECNDAFARMRGFGTGREMAGMAIESFLPPDEHNLEVIRTLIRAGYRGQQRETHEIDRQGRPKYFLSNVVGIIEKGKLARIWGTQRDITEHRALEEQLRQAQKMEAVGRLAGGVAHDFNNLLMVIGGYGELLRDETPAHPVITKHVDAILKAADRAGALTRQLLAFGRKQVLKPKVLDVNAVVQETGKLLLRLIGEHIELSLALDPQTGLVKADPGQLEQVLMNLAINARDAMPDGGKLRIETGNVQLGEDFANQHPAVAPGNYVMLSVADTGTGMDEKTRAQVFEPFFTTKERGQGTGLGLATVYGIVRQSGGYVWAQSTLGSGSTFRVYLPRVLDATAELESTGEAEPFARGAETILVAEDELDVRALACTFLRSQGYTVLEGLDPQHALRLAQENLGQLRLLVTDVVMPGMRGTELAERVVQLSPFVGVLYISGYTDQAIDSEGILDKGANLLTKPFSRDALLQRVRQVLDEQAGSSEELRMPGKAPYA